DLRAAGVPVGVLSNSEGRLAELIEEIGWGDDLAIVADSRRLGVEKPDPAIFARTAARPGVPADEILPLGGSGGADRQGGLGGGSGSAGATGGPRRRA